MTGIQSGPRSVPIGESDIYTVLLLVSFLFLLVATIYVAYRAVTLFGGLLPPGGA
ncbi:MAG: hypothetical protein AB1601_13505 [Planctomycetota bacterium]|jgi:hypothetical protein